MADISRSILQSIDRATTLVEKHDLQLNQKQCRCLVNCLEQVKECLFSRPIRIYRQLLERIRRIVKKIENFVIKCNSKEWLVNTLSVGVSEEKTKDFILELRWCLNHVQCTVANLEDQGQESQDPWTPPQMVLPSEEDIRHDRQSLVNKLHFLLSGTGVGCEMRDMASYVQGRLQVLEGDGKCEPSLEHLLWKLKLQEPSKHELLGRGGSAMVFKTSWLGVPSALKSLLRCCGDKFLREAGILAMLNHPNIVKLYCCYEDRKSQSLVMELMDGSLSDLLRERRENRNGSPFEIDEAVEILLQIVKGMMYLHKNGFAHRDLKCLNILVKRIKGSQTCFSTGDFSVKVADFELVKLFDPTNSNSMTVTQNVGTTIWRAPEVLKNNAKIKPRRADIYSFGMVCFEVLTGEEPFEHCGFSTKELRNMIIEDDHRPRLPEDCPVHLRTLIEECWNANPELRPSFEEIYYRLLDYRSFLMLGTSVIETQDVQIAEPPAITRAMMSCIKMGEFLVSLCINIEEVDAETSNTQRQRLESLSPDEALDQLDKAINQPPANDVDALSQRGEAKLKLQEDFRGSLVNFDEKDVLQPNDGETLKRKGQIKHMVEDYEGASKNVDDALRLISNDSCLLIKKSQLKRMRKDYKGALKELNAANDLAPYDALILSLRGEMKKNLKDFKGALEDFYEVSNLDPNDVSIQSEIAQVKRIMQYRMEVKKEKRQQKEKGIAQASNVRKGHICRKFPCPICCPTCGAIPDRRRDNN